MFKQTRKDLEDALSCAEKLLRAKIYNPKEIEDNVVPSDIGVYLWRDNKGNIVYVGRALWREGLHQRIVAQHLSKSHTQSVF